MRGLLTKLANCCNPLPGDEIVGFVSRGKGAIVHRSDCGNVARFIHNHSERIINVNWQGVSLSHYHAPIIITANDRTGLIRDIATTISDIGANLLVVTSRVNRNIATISATLEVDSLESLQRLFMRLEKVKGLTHVERDMGKKRR